AHRSGGGLLQAQHGPPERGLTAAGLAHQAVGAPGLDRQAHPVHGPDVPDGALDDDAPADREVDLEVPHVQQGPRLGRGLGAHAISSAMTQRCAWAVPIRGGSPSTHFSATPSQRGANAQPSFQRMTSAIEPRIGLSGSWIGRSSRGIEFSRPTVYGWVGRANRSRAGADSTTRPEYRTLTSSHRPATTPRSWVIMSSAVPSASTRSFSSSRICAWIVTSSAVVGSSAMRSRGAHA